MDTFSPVLDGEWDAIVIPSGSCTGAARHEQGLVAEHVGDTALAKRVEQIAAHTYDLTELLIDVLGTEDVGAYFPHTVTYHPTCHSLRMLRVGDRPLQLLRAVRGIDLRELPGAQECCGFGGTFAVKNADETARLAVEKGGKVTKGPDDIPGTGRFAVLTDPQGAYFGILQPAPMEREPSPDQFAWNQQKAGRGNWLELMSTDPKAGFDFYAALFGWTKGTAMPMGEAGDYQIFERNGTQIGGMMALGDSPVPNWLPYFGADGKVSAAIERINADLVTFADMARLQTPPTEELLLASAPWER